MKVLKSISVVILTTIIFFACKGDPKQAAETAETIIENAEKTQDKPTDTRTLAKRLKELKPVSDGALESWLPEQLTTMPRKKIEKGQPGFEPGSAVIGYYESGRGSDWSQIQIHVLDGAGQTFSPKVIAQIKMHDLEFNEDINGDSNRTVMYKGLKVHQTYNKEIGSSNLQFIIDQRFSVRITAINPALETVWNEIEVLDFDALKNLK
ncbi:hypothetical protein [Seonamhaeicola maritimus]|uniref:hypothetical protein n=1 Tax=Seonamhaeicola maritimus TaxID=2591822 RepID=UPI0024959852|nr:hypothetical protein [Seonamhaeicola maritimus]